MHKLLRFGDEKLLDRALTHKSYANENPQKGKDNERLEFLGDAILNFLAGEYVYFTHPDGEEGELTRRRSTLVDEKQLANFAIEVGLKSRIKLGKGDIQRYGRESSNLLSSTFEALIGAYYLDNDCNIEIVHTTVKPLFESVPKEVLVDRSDLDSKNRLQEWVQANIGPTQPKYSEEKIGGCDHNPVFKAIVSVRGNKWGEGTGKSKKEAQKAAAKHALANLKKQGLL
jgi:ribonuclease-3